MLEKSQIAAILWTLPKSQFEDDIYLYLSLLVNGKIAFYRELASFTAVLHKANLTLFLLNCNRNGERVTVGPVPMYNEEEPGLINASKMRVGFDRSTRRDRFTEEDHTSAAEYLFR